MTCTQCGRPADVLYQAAAAAAAPPEEPRCRGCRDWWPVRVFVWAAVREREA